MIETYDKSVNKIEIEEIEALPKNVRQIGDARDEYRIYMEDYAYTYLHQYAAKDKANEQIAFLVGKIYKYKEEYILIINGAIQAKFLQKENGNLFITDDTWIYVKEKVNQYFNNNGIVGWMYTQPGYGILLTSFLNEQHKKHFGNLYQVLYIIDPLEKEHAFFISKDNELREKKGYYIFYDKNNLMHEYMMDYKIVNTINEKETNNHDIVRTYRRVEQNRKEEHDQKKFINMLSLISGALVIICVIIGIGLLNNMEKMNKMQATMSLMNDDYNKLKQQVANDPGRLDEQEDDQNEQPAVENNEDREDMNDSEPAEKDANPVKDSESPQGDEGEKESEVDQTSSSDVPRTYIIKPGDNLNTISIKFYHSKDMVPAIQELNNIDNPNKIYVGQHLILPQP